jgi:hypothetical protein
VTDTNAIKLAQPQRPLCILYPDILNNDRALSMSVEILARGNVGYWGKAGKHLLSARFTGFDRCC